MSPGRTERRGQECVRCVRRVRAAGAGVHQQHEWSQSVFISSVGLQERHCEAAEFPRQSETRRTRWIVSAQIRVETRGARSLHRRCRAHLRSTHVRAAPWSGAAITERVSTPPRSPSHGLTSTWTLVCGSATSPPTLPDSQAGLHVSAAGKCIRACLDGSDGSPRQLLQKLRCWKRSSMTSHGRKRK